MGIRNRMGIVTIVLLGLSTQLLAEETLFRLGKKNYTRSDLAPATRQQMYEADLRSFRETKAIIESALLDLYFAEKAKKSKKSKEELEVDELKIAEPSEKDIKKFYEENKQRIPPGYKYEQVKPEIQRLLKGQRRQAKRASLIAEIKKKQGFEFQMKEPVAPKLSIKTDGFARKGKTGAKIQIVEFADYQCPHCKAAAGQIKKFMKEFSKSVELVYIDFPINRSGISQVIAEGAYCAKEQNKYWEYHEMAFTKQAELSKDTPEKFAKELKLKVDDFKKCLKSAAAKAYVARGKAEGQRVGVSGTPSVYINGKRLAKGVTYEALKEEVERLTTSS